MSRNDYIHDLQKKIMAEVGVESIAKDDNSTSKSSTHDQHTNNIPKGPKDDMSTMEGNGSNFGRYGNVSSIDRKESYVQTSSRIRNRNSEGHFSGFDPSREMNDSSPFGRTSQTRSEAGHDPRRGPIDKSHIHYRQDPRRGPSGSVSAKSQGSFPHHNEKRETWKDAYDRRNGNRGHGQNFHMDSAVSKPRGSRFNNGRPFINRGKFGVGNHESDGSHSRYSYQAGGNNSGTNSVGSRFNTRSRSTFAYNPNLIKAWTPGKDIDWSQVYSLKQRSELRPTSSKFDETPEGFEHVPAERAKMSGLFPLPGQPQTIDHSLLQDVVSKGVLNRRTRILFEDTSYTNLLNLRMNRTLVMSPVILGFADHEKVISVIKYFITHLEYDLDEESRSLSWSIENNRIIVVFGNEALVTIVLACQKYLEKIAQAQFIWQRPSEYVNHVSSPEPLLSENTLAILKTSDQCQDADSTVSWLQKEEVEYSWLQTFKLRENDKDNTKNLWINALLYLPKTANTKRLPLTIRPNECALKMDLKEIKFSTIPDLVKRDERKPSKVICIMNSIDPMDLKNERFVKEVREAMTFGTPIVNCGEVESVRIPLPNPDYRNDMNHIHSSIGKVFVKFKDLISAERAMLTLPGSQFCQRTIICSYYSEKDYDLGLF